MFILIGEIWCNKKQKCEKIIKNSNRFDAHKADATLKHKFNVEAAWQKHHKAYFVGSFFFRFLPN